MWPLWIKDGEYAFYKWYEGRCWRRPNYDQTLVTFRGLNLVLRVARAGWHWLFNPFGVFDAIYVLSAHKRQLKMAKGIVMDLRLYIAKVVPDSESKQWLDETNIDHWIETLMADRKGSY